MTRPLSPIHAPLDADPPSSPPPIPRIARLAKLDSRPLSGLPRSLGPGGASSAFARAVDKALVDEMADQLRGLDTGESEIGDWAGEIIAAFCEE
jgi:hypothetical protein